MGNRPDLPVSFVAETNKGGVPMTLCSCGVVLVTGDFAWAHIDDCSAAIAARTEIEQADPPLTEEDAHNALRRIAREADR